jgi:hypothetical protein
MEIDGGFYIMEVCLLKATVDRKKSVRIRACDVESPDVLELCLTVKEVRRLAGEEDIVWETFLTQLSVGPDGELVAAPKPTLAPPPIMTNQLKTLPEVDELTP